MMGNSIDPRPQRATAIVTPKTPPQLEMNLLRQIPPLLRIRFVSPCQPFERRPELPGGVAIQRILICVSWCYGCLSAHTKIVAGAGGFLQPALQFSGEGG